MIQSVLKAIDIMGVFTPEEPYLSLGQISKRLSMPKSTTHNLMATLISQGFMEKVNDDYYALGTAIISLSQAVRVNAELRDRAAPLLRELAEIVKESVYLTYFDGTYILYIYAIESSKRLMARTAVGERVQLHCTGNGKSILAALSIEQVEAIVEEVGLPVFTDTTINSIDQLHEDLEQTRKRGYSIDNQEHEPGTYCLGAVIRDGHGLPIGGCSIAGTDEQIIKNQPNSLANDLLYVAQEISRRMGYVPATPSLLVQKTEHFSNR
jgi:IclR family transcriptional regulator, acetate operon repressor